MKWNFECESDRRDYLHIHIVKRRNGFCMLGGYAPISTRCAAADLNRFEARSTRFSNGGMAARRSLPARKNIQPAISLTALRLLLGFVDR
jgi:hypothetical protein